MIYMNNIPSLYIPYDETIGDKRTEKRHSINSSCGARENPPPPPLAQ